MMRTGLVLFVLLHAAVATAQETVVARGRVVAADTGAPVSGARVAFGGLPTHVRTDPAGRFELIQSPAPAAAYFGSAVVTVGATSPPAVVIATSTGSTLSGRIVLEGPSAGVTPSSFELRAQPGGRKVSGIPSGPAAEVAEDWSFQMRGIGEPAFSFSGPPGWWLKSLQIGGVESADLVVPFGRPEASSSDAIVVISRTGAEVSGNVSDERGRAMNYLVVAFPVDPNGWFQGSRFIRVGRPNQAGTYALNLPPGEYWIAAVDEVAFPGPETFGSIVPFAERIVLGAQERARRDLRFARLPT